MKKILVFILIPLVVIVAFLFLNQKKESNLPAAADLVLVQPADGQKIASPLKISGRARGNWFFEATFPVILTDWDGKIIAESYATAQGEWMTEDFVPFIAEVSFEKPAYGERGALILKNANPSGLPENDEAHEITVFFE